MKPQRIQRKRTKGWKMLDNTVYVGRPSRWGNPFEMDTYTRKEAIEMYNECLLNNGMVYYYIWEIQASIEYKRFKWMSENILSLKGKNLACWCKEGEPCHADILLKLANQ